MAQCNLSIELGETKTTKLTAPVILNGYILFSIGLEYVVVRNINFNNMENEVHSIQWAKKMELVL